MSQDTPHAAHPTSPELRDGVDYEAPRLQEIGTLADLTLGEGLGEDDGFDGASVGPS